MLIDVYITDLIFSYVEEKVMDLPQTYKILIG